MDCTWITAIRTAVATSLTARYLAAPDSKSVAILGCGVQGRYNLVTINTVFKLSTVAIYDISKEIATRYQTVMASKIGLDIEAAADPQSAIKCADIITSINIGIALEDMAVAPIVYLRARESKIGTWLEI